MNHHHLLNMLKDFSEHANYDVQSLLNDLRIGIMRLKFDEKMNLETPAASEYQFYPLSVPKISMTVIHFADVAFSKILPWISIDFCNHWSSIWFNNSMILPAILNDVDKNTFKNILFHTLPFLSVQVSHTVLFHLICESLIQFYYLD